jgi:GNAT superfamily N-acetyltransferase
MSKKEFLGNAPLSVSMPGLDLGHGAYWVMTTVPGVPFLDGTYQLHRGDHLYVVADGEVPIASFDGTHLWVEPDYRRMGIATELVYRVRTECPGFPKATQRTPVAQRIILKVYDRIVRENHAANR